MAALRPTGLKGGIGEEMLMPGDIMLGGESMSSGALATAGSGTWLAAAIASGIIYRTGPGGAFTDTTDTAANIIAALAGNNPYAAIIPGSTLRLTLINTVAFAHTFAAGAGVIAGVGVLSAAASSVREYLVTILALGPVSTLPATTTNGLPTITFVQPIGQTAFPLTGYNALNIVAGMSVSGAGIPASTTVLGTIQGQGGLIGVTLSANATATVATPGTALTFTPSVKIDGIRSTSL